MNHQHFLKKEAKHPLQIFYLPHLPPCSHLVYLLHCSFESINLYSYALVSHSTNNLLVLLIETSFPLTFLLISHDFQNCFLLVIQPLLCVFKALPDVDPPKIFPWVSSLKITMITSSYLRVLDPKMELLTAITKPFQLLGKEHKIKRTLISSSD